MSPRVGTIVALVAAALLAISLATSSWWSGSPTLDGKTINRKTAHIGLITASQCNYDDVADQETECKHLAMGGTFGALKFVQLGATGVLALVLLGLALARDRRRGFAKLVMITVAVSAVMSVVLLLVGPDLKTGRSESMPLGYSIFLMFGGTALAIAGGVGALMPARAAKPPGWATPPAMPAPQPGFDVESLLAQDALRPAALGPEPMLRKQQAAVAPAPSGPQPLFADAPQLRPLYEATGAYVPPPPVQFPSRGPTPMSHMAVSALVGVDPPPPPPPKLPPIPTRTKPLSVAPPIPMRSAPVTKPPPLRTHPTQISASVPPPPRPGTDTEDRSVTTDFEKATGDDPSLPFDTATAENKAFGGEDQTTIDGSDDLETAARSKISSTDVELVKRPSSSIVTSAAPIARKTPQPIQVPISTAPESLPPPPADAEAAGGPSPACPQCESPMSWVEEHLRFYCKSCRMYF